MIDLNMVTIPAGQFVMGSSEDEIGRGVHEGPQHLVTIEPFLLQETAVTREQWMCVMGSDPSHFQDGDLTCPVENVSWHDCQHFIAKLNAIEDANVYRLPSEAEWEYACRAGTTSPFSTGNEISSDQANFDGELVYNRCIRNGVYRGRTVSVRSFAPNAWGLHEMHGNVWEWVHDAWHDSYDGAPSNGNAWELSGREQQYRVIRGGSWFDHPSRVRSAIRTGGSWFGHCYNIGFRLARSISM